MRRPRSHSHDRSLPLRLIDRASALQAGAAIERFRGGRAVNLMNFRPRFSSRNPGKGVIFVIFRALTTWLCGSHCVSFERTARWALATATIGTIRTTADAGTGSGGGLLGRLLRR